MKFVSKIILLSMLVCACQTQEPANVEYHITDYYGYKTNSPDDVVNPSIEIEDVSQDYQNPIASDVEIEDVSQDFNPDMESQQDQVYGPKTVPTSQKNNVSDVPDEVVYGPNYEKHEKDQEEKIELRKRSDDPVQTISVSGTKHTITKGDTLYSLSRKYDIPILPIIIANHLSEPYELKTGQVVDIPNAKFHIVSDSDTLYSISRKYSVDMTSLAKMNNLSEPYSIYKRQKLQIPFANYSAQEAITARADELITVPDNLPADEGEKVLVAEKLPNENIKFTSLGSKEAKAITNKKSSKGFLWPINGKVIKNFGGSGNNYNDGINIAGTVGQSVKSTKDGKVVFTGDSLKSFGNLVIVKHNDGLLTAYAHLSSISVKKDQSVKQGAELGKVGNTGKVDSPQLYFAVRKGKQSMNPMNYLQ